MPSWPDRGHRVGDLDQKHFIEEGPFNPSVLRNDYRYNYGCINEQQFREDDSGNATGTHAHRRTSAVEMKNEKYKKHLKDGKTTKKASEMAVQDAVEHLGHSRNRRDLALAYLDVS